MNVLPCSSSSDPVPTEFHLGWSASYRKIRKAFRNPVDFMLFKNFKIPVQCRRIKPSVPPCSPSARELFRAGTTTLRHLARVVWKGIKIGFPGCFQRWGFIELTSAAFTQAKVKEGLSEYEMSLKSRRCSERFYLLVPPICLLLLKGRTLLGQQAKGIPFTPS